jgi:hypothetical protein
MVFVRKDVEVRAVFLMLDSGSANGSPMMGSTVPTNAATDILVRNLTAEVGPRGVRVVGIWTAGLPETFSKEKLTPAEGGRGHGGVSGLRKGRRHYRYVSLTSPAERFPVSRSRDDDDRYGRGET